MLGKPPSCHTDPKIYFFKTYLRCLIFFKQNSIFRINKRLIAYSRKEVWVEVQQNHSTFSFVLVHPGHSAFSNFVSKALEDMLEAMSMKCSALRVRLEV